MIYKIFGDKKWVTVSIGCSGGLSAAGNDLGDVAEKHIA